MKDKVLEKLLSGRFWATIGIIATFCWIAIQGKLPAEAVLAVTLVVTKDYFSRDRKGE